MPHTSSEPPRHTPMSVLLVDPHTLLRIGVAALIEAQPDMRVLAQAGSLEQAQALRDHGPPDVLCIDLASFGHATEEKIRAWRRANPGVPVVVLTHRLGEEDIYRAVRAGVAAYLPKSTPPDALLQALRSVHCGGTFMPPSVSARLGSRLQRDALSRREMQILEQVAAGHGNKRIGQALGISDGTVKSHTKRIFDKLGARSRAKAVGIAVLRGLVAMPYVDRLPRR